MSSRKIPSTAQIGANIRKYRNLRGLSQKELGRLAFDLPESDWSKGQQKISELERGLKKYPTIDDVYLVASSLKVKIEDLLKID